jgi:very-short-patch-repair endonuclease
VTLETRHHVPPVMLARARAMRHTAAPAEQKLWQCLRGRQLCGYKFRRQQPLAPYIADFFCAEVKLVVELDGESHGEREAYDAQRTRRLVRGGLNVIRFENDDVYQFLDTVLDEILRECEQLAPHPSVDEPEHTVSAGSGEPRPPSPLAGEGGGEG